MSQPNHVSRTRFPRRRSFLAYFAVRVLILSMFAVAGTPGAFAETTDERTSTFALAQTMASAVPLGGTTRVMALVGGIDGSVPSGTVDYYACAPARSGGGTCSTGTRFGSATLDASGFATSPSYRPSSGGLWCFRAAYLGSALHGPTAASGPSACTDVLRSASDILLAADQATAAQNEGATATATVYGVGSGPAPTGQVTFSACPVASLDVPSCTAAHVPVGNGTLTAVSTGSSRATSPGFFAPSPGAWCFRAAYDGDASHHGSTIQGSSACYDATAPAAPDAPTDGDTTDGDTTAPDDNATTSPAGPPARGLGWWKNHDWSTGGLTLAGTTYDEAALRALLDGPIKGDAGKLLGRHLIVVKLNQAAGTIGAEADEAIDEADALLTELGGPHGGASQAKGVRGAVGDAKAALAVFSGK